jgi:alpha-beta hydrolase superfamily lysophospholipase
MAKIYRTCLKNLPRIGVEKTAARDRIMNNPAASHAMNTPSIGASSANSPHSFNASASPASVEWLTASDGHRIPLRCWPIPQARAIIHIVHGMAEHSGRYADTAALLNAAGYSVAAHDHRCHGLATNLPLGNIDSQQHWAGICHDMAVVNADLHQRYPDLPIAVLGHSMGSFIAQYFAQHHPEQLNLLLLEGGSFEAPWFTALAAWLGRFESRRQGQNGRSALIHALSFGGFNKAFHKPRTDYDWLSRDIQFVDSYIADPLCNFQMANGFWRDFVQALSRLYRPSSMRKIRVDLPVYLFSGERDPVGHMGRSVKRLARCYLETVGSRDVTLCLYPDARHDLLHETNRDEVVTDVLGWINRRLPS